MRILLALDDSTFSEAVIRALIAQAPPKSSEVRVLHVIEPLPAIYGGSEWGYVMDWQAVTREHRKQAEALMARAAQTLRAAGFEITTAIEEGAPKAVILDVAGKWPANLIMVGSHGRRPWIASCWGAYQRRSRATRPARCRLCASQNGDAASSGV